MHIDYSVLDNCKNLEDSYGEICVQCNKCARNPEIQDQFVAGEGEQP